MEPRQLTPSPRTLGLIDQAAFAVWSVLLIVWAARGLGVDDTGRFSVIYLAMVTAVQVARPFVAEPLVLVRDPDRPDVVLGGGLGLVGIAVALCLPLSIVGLATERWELLCAAVVALAVAQDALRSLAVATGSVFSTLVSDTVLVVAFIPGVLLAGRWDLSLSSLLGLLEGALLLACLVTLPAIRRGPMSWRPGEWWSRCRRFAIGATVGGTIDLFVVNACFALPAVLGHGSVTAALTAGRTLFAVPTTLIGSWLYAWTWRHRDSHTVPRHTAVRLMSISVVTTLAWAGATALFGRAGLVELFGEAGAGLRSILAPLTVFYVLVAISVVAKSVLRVVREPGRARRASWTGDVALVAATLLLAGSSSRLLATAMAVALVPLALGYLHAVRAVTVDAVGPTPGIGLTGDVAGQRSAA